jgi:ATP adenylyltransferase
MDRLWSPWRLAYVTAAAGTGTPSCIFCSALDSNDAESLVLFRGATCYAVLNLYPYNNGHLMIVPNRHVATLAGLTDEELADLMRFTQRAELAIEEAYHPQGMNIGINLGRPAGAGIVDHVHVHVVPRWTGDTNFMSAIGETRVLPEDLETTAKRLRPIFQKLASAS